MVGTNIGAGRMVRARRVAWIGAGLAAAMTGSVGLVGACFPRLAMLSGTLAPVYANIIHDWSAALTALTVWRSGGPVR